MYERTVAAERIMRFDVTRKLNLCLSAFAACLEVLDRGSGRKGFLRFALNYLFFLPSFRLSLPLPCLGVVESVVFPIQSILLRARCIQSVRRSQSSYGRFFRFKHPLISCSSSAPQAFHYSLDRLEVNMQKEQYKLCSKDM